MVDAVAFELVQMARMLREQECKSRRSILRILKNNHGVNVDIDTLNDWLYLRTRLSA